MCMCMCVRACVMGGGGFPSYKKCCISSGEHLSFRDTEITARLQDFVFFTHNPQMRLNRSLNILVPAITDIFKVLMAVQHEP